jgi:hypothetical protein
VLLADDEMIIGDGDTSSKPDREDEFITLPGTRQKLDFENNDLAHNNPIIVLLLVHSIDHSNTVEHLDVVEKMTEPTTCNGVSTAVQYDHVTLGKNVAQNPMFIVCKLLSM